MTVSEIQKKIDEYDYWDSRVKAIECNYFADEVHMIYNDDNGNGVHYSFIGCYKSVFDHDKGYNKRIPVKNMTLPQVPYFLQDVKIDEITEEEYHFWICKINMYPLNLEIWCRDIKIERERC